MPRSLPPTSDTGLRDFAVNFDTISTATPGAIGLTAAQALALHGKVVDYLAKLLTATEPTTRTKVTVEQKNISKTALIDDLRGLIKIVNAYPGTDNDQRIALGLHVRDASPSPRPAPTTQPLVTIAGTGGGQAVVRLRDQATPDKKAKPFGVFGSVVATEVTAAGADAPSFAGGKFDAVATRTTHTLTLPPDSVGKTLWVQARWINERGQPGPASVVTSALIAA